MNTWNATKRPSELIDEARLQPNQRGTHMTDRIGTLISLLSVMAWGCAVVAVPPWPLTGVGSAGPRSERNAHERITWRSATQSNGLCQGVNLALRRFMDWQVSRSITFSTGSAASSLSARASHNAIMLFHMALG